MKTNHESRMPSNKSENLALSDGSDRTHRMRNQSCSASSTLSSASSISSFAISNLNQTYLPDILIVYPNGLQISKKLDARKAVYDILVELSATAKLIPTNYSLKLFSKDESDSNSNNYKLIDYTPNQTIGHLNPAKITIVPKTTTLKHQQHQLFPLETEVAKSAGHLVNLNSYAKSLSHPKTPFELTIRVGVNLPFNQKTAVRVRPDISLADLIETICKEASLDPNRYDLVINSKIHQASMQIKFNSFDTNEVNLVLKSYDKSQNRLNSKSSIATFHQNSTKSRSQKKLIPNTKSNCQSAEKKSINKIKSKSELDLSIGSTDSDTFKGSTSNLSIKSSMFSFFTRKKNRKSKSKTSLYEDCTSLNSNSLKKDYVSSTSSIKSTTSSQLDNHHLLSKANKKRPAPPPPTGHNLNSVPEGNEAPRYDFSKEINQNRSKSVNDGRNAMTDLDRETLDKIICLTRKKKKAAPLPPSQNDQQKSLKVLTDMSPHSHNNSECKTEDPEEKYSTSPPSFPSPSLSDSSSVLSSKNENSTKLDEKNDHYSPSIESGVSLNEENGKILDKDMEKEELRNIDCDSLNMASVTTSFEKQSNMTTDNSTLPNKMEDNKDESVLDEIKKENDDSILISDENCVRSFHGAVVDHKIFSEDDHSDLESIKALNSPMVTTSPLNQSTYSVQNMSNQITKVVINKNLEPKIKQNENTATLKLDTKIPEVLVEATNRSSVQPYDAEPENTTSKIDSDEETQIDININSYRTPLKKTAVIEVRPEFETSSLIKIADQSIDEKIPEKKRPNLQLKSPASPPPQFPALTEKDKNEQHQNYTVVRHGDIIEKNGIYYSTDGTVRGYSGIVKRLANSKALNEVFNKQQEIEQNNEKEYQLELQKRELDKQKQSSRSSIGTIVANEKKVASNQVRTVQYRKNMDNRPVVKTTLEDELGKKLESRRQTIAKINLEVDTSSTQSTSTNSSPSIDNSSAHNSPQSYFMSQNLYSIAQRKNSPSFVMSAKVRDSNSSMNKINHENLAQSRNSLFEELKSVVSESNGELDKGQSPSQLSTFQPKINRPHVAPKNFNSSTKETIQNKKQILNAREDLMDSIKSFSVTSLRKINRHNI